MMDNQVKYQAMVQYQTSLNYHQHSKRGVSQFDYHYPNGYDHGHICQYHDYDLNDFIILINTLFIIITIGAIYSFGCVVVWIYCFILRKGH